jgi:MFS family permease
VIANGATFLLSAAVLATLRFGRAPRADAGASTGLLAQAREGVAAVSRMRGIRTLVLSSSGAILFGSMLNVAELLLARSLHSGSVGYAMLVAACGAGVVAGSLSGGRGAPLAGLRRRYLLGILLIALGLVAAVVPSYPLAAAGLGLAGFGNGLALVNERLICQRVVPDGFLARTFAVFDTAGSWAFAVAFIAAGAVLSVAGVRTVLVVAGLGTLAIWALAASALRSAWPDDQAAVDRAAVTPAAKPAPGA